jgi:hypothetical protein
MVRLLFLLTIFCSLISQTPSLLEAGLDVYLKLMWILPFCMLILISPRSFISNKIIPFAIYLFFFAYFCFSCQMMTEKKYFTADLYNVALDFIFATTSFVFWKKYGCKKNMEFLAITMAIGGLFLAVNVYTNFLTGSDINSQTYAFDAKNSMGQILLCSAFVVITFYSPSNKVMNWSSKCIAAICLFVMVLVRSRATLVSALVIAFYYFLKLKNKKLKIGICLVGLLVVVYILSSANLYEIVIQGIVMGGRDADDLNSLSSNRMLLIPIALAKIPNHWWIGNGDYYVDCMPINFMVQYGIVGSLITFVFILYVFFKLKKYAPSHPIIEATFALYLSFLVNGLFEAQAPFGPGIKSFVLWMFFGFALAEMEKEQVNQYIVPNKS